MRIGIFTECYDPVMNGVVVSIKTFTKALEKRGHEFYIFTTECPGYQEKDDHVTRFESALPFKPKGGKYPIAAPQDVNEIASKVQKLNLDLIHSQHLLNTGELGLKVAKKINLPAVLTYHTLMTQYVHYLPVLGNIAQKWIIKRSRFYGNQYDAIVTPSPAMKKLLIKYDIKTPITPIPTGIELDHFMKHYSKEELKKKYKIPDDHDFLYLYVSRIGKEKNVYFLIKAIERLVKQRGRRDVHLLMVGGGDELEHTKNFVKKIKMENYITFTGGLPKDETNKTFGGTDVFVFASITETQGIIIQEAQASGLPIIAINKMGPGDYINNNVDGILTDLNLNQFVGKMEYLLNHPEERQKLSKNAKENVKKFTAEKSALKMEKLYEETRNNHRSKQKTT